MKTIWLNSSKRTRTFLKLREELMRRLMTRSLKRTRPKRYVPKALKTISQVEIPTRKLLVLELTFSDSET